MPWSMRGTGTKASPDGSRTGCASIYEMTRISRILIFALLLAALPLRGFAGDLMVLCGEQHGGSAAVQGHAQDDGGGHDGHGDHGDVPAQTASVCSVCASCCAGAGLVPDAPAVGLPPAATSDRIAFLPRRFSGIVPEHLDRPPLAP